MAELLKDERSLGMLGFVIWGYPSTNKRRGMKMKKGQFKKIGLRLGRDDFSRVALVLGTVVLLCFTAARLGAQDIGPQLPQDIAVSTAAVNVSDRVGVAFDGTNYLVVWRQTAALPILGTDIYARLVSAAGVPLGNPFVVVEKIGQDQEPAVAYGGGMFLVVWTDLHDIQGRLISPAGQPEGNRLRISEPDNVKDQLAVASDGTGFLVVWKDCRYYVDNDVYGQFVGLDASGSLTLIGSNFPVSPIPGDAFRPAVAYGGGKYLVTWMNDPAENALLYDLHGSLVPPLGTPGAPFTIAGGTDLQGSYDVAPSIAFDGTNFLVTYTDNASGSLQLKGTRVSPIGAVLDTGFLITNDPGDGWSKVAYGDGEYLVVLISNGVKGIRISTEGQVLDPQPANLSVMTDPGFLPAVTYGDGSYLVTWELGETPSVPYLPFAKYAQLIGPIADDSDGDGVPDDADACPNEDATGFDFNGDGCIDSISGLAGFIGTLVQSGVIEPELQTSLLAKVENAEKSATKDNICAAINQLNALKNQVNAQRENKISPEAADEIIYYADSVIAYLLSQLPAGESC